MAQISVGWVRLTTPRTMADRKEQPAAPLYMHSCLKRGISSKTAALAPFHVSLLTTFN